VGGLVEDGEANDDAERVEEYKVTRRHGDKRGAVEGLGFRV